MCNKELHLLEIVEHHKCDKDSAIPLVVIMFLVIIGTILGVLAYDLLPIRCRRPSFYKIYYIKEVNKMKEKLNTLIKEKDELEIELVDSTDFDKRFIQNRLIVCLQQISATVHGYVAEIKESQKRKK